ncbi:i-spanin [Escherichia phage Sciku]|nr:i-spanin [Escherichia phage Shashou]QEG06881.1 i-spanin [Escherichia phage Sciku]
MNPKATVVAGACFILLTYGYGIYQYRSGWNEGRANLVSQQQQEAQAELAKKTQRQQQDESKAAAADNEGKTKSEVITREVVKYIKTPGRSVCTFDDARVLLKSHAVANANSIPGYDDDAAAVQTGTAK